MSVKAIKNNLVDMIGTYHANDANILGTITMRTVITKFQVHNSLSLKRDE